MKSYSFWMQEFVKNTSEKNAIVHSEHAPEKVYIGAAFNYSSQALNSTSLSKEKLLQILSKVITHL